METASCRRRNNQSMLEPRGRTPSPKSEWPSTRSCVAESHTADAAPKEAPSRTSSKRRVGKQRQRAGEAEGERDERDHDALLDDRLRAGLGEQVGARGRERETQHGDDDSHHSSPADREAEHADGLVLVDVHVDEVDHHQHRHGHGSDDDGERLRTPEHEADHGRDGDDESRAEPAERRRRQSREERGGDVRHPPPLPGGGGEPPRGALERRPAAHAERESRDGLAAARAVPFRRGLAHPGVP